MKLRKPRTTIPKETYWQGMLKLFHPLMFAPILMLVTIGTFLSNEVDLQVYLLELIAVFFAVLSAYHLDEAKEKVTAPSIPVEDNIKITLICFFIGGTIGMYFIFRNPLLWIPFIIAVWGVLGYNLDIKFFKNRFWYALAWGATPIFGSYMLQTGGWPNLTVLAFSIFGMLLATKLFWAWSLRTCGRWTICPKCLGIPDLKSCHSPGTVRCFDRLQMPKEVNDTMKILQKLDLLILFALMIGVIL